VKATVQYYLPGESNSAARFPRAARQEARTPRANLYEEINFTSLFMRG